MNSPSCTSNSLFLWFKRRTENLGMYIGPDMLLQREPNQFRQSQSAGSRLWGRFAWNTRFEKWSLFRTFSRLCKIIFTYLSLNCIIKKSYQQNHEVVNYITIPNVKLNCDVGDLEKPCRYFSGDWGSLHDLLDRYDTLLTSETIYNPDNYSKLLALFDRVLKPNGCM